VSAEILDVAVIGAGIVGIACAEACSEEGLRVVVLEEDRIGSGATGAGTGHIVALPVHGHEFALTRYSQELWRRRAGEWPPGVRFRTCGAIWLASGAGDWALLETAHRFLMERGTPAELLSMAETLQREPALSPTISGGLWVPEDLVIVPAEATKHLWARSAARGAILREGLKVESVDHGSLRLSNGEVVRARHVVLAAGTGTRELVPQLPLRPRKGHVLHIDTPPDLVRHQLLEASYLSALGSKGLESIAFNAQPGPGRGTLLGSSRQYDVASAEVEERVLRLIRERAERFLPGVSRYPVIRQWTGSRPASEDGLPFIGPVPGRPEIIVATGHEGIGITTSLATGRLVADIILDRASAIPRAPYALDHRGLPFGLDAGSA
jgi:glycine/D-amino acid oxidase-like deaminating enzyme